MTILFLVLTTLFLFQSNNLLLTLLLLELMSFLLLFITSFYMSPSLSSDFFLVALFAIFVIEGVIGLSGLIMLVTFTGSDYVSSSSLINS